jgi:hypothetical protein
MNHMHLSCCSRSSAVSFAAGTNFGSVVSLGVSWTSLLEFCRPGGIRGVNGRVRRLPGLARSRSFSVARSSSQLGT